MPHFDSRTLRTKLSRGGGVRRLRLIALKLPEDARRGAAERVDAKMASKERKIGRHRVIFQLVAVVRTSGRGRGEGALIEV